jgi:sugar lactone lactonase YvrE
MEFELVVDGCNIVGEGPVWDDRRHCLWWTDIMNRVLFRLDWPGRALASFAMPRRLASIGLCESSRLVLGFEDGVYLHEPGSERFDCLALIESDIPTNRLNDGKVGPDGAFWVGSMDERTPRHATGALYRVTSAGAAKVFGDVIVSNGLAWTADGKTMVHTDSTRSEINAYSFDKQTGALGNKRFVVKPDESTGRPDGGAFDNNDCYWSAGVSGGNLNKWSLDGTLLTSHPMPTPHPTMPCFGGPDLDLVFVTSLRSMGDKTDLARWPHSGGLFIAKFMARSGVRGVPVSRFKD